MKREVLNIFQINLIESARRREFAASDRDRSRHVLCFPIGFGVTVAIIVVVIADLPTLFALLWVILFLRVFLRGLP